MSYYKRELAEARRDGAKPQKNSGRGTHKGDAVIEDNFLVDYKEASKSFAINEKVWGKISTDALTEGLQPMLKIILGERPLRLWVVPEYVMDELLDAWKEVNAKGNE